MKTLLKTSIAISALLLLGISSCKKDDNNTVTPTPTEGSLKVQFDYVFGSSMLPWELNKQFIHPKTGDTLNFSMFRFYVSNIKLKNENGIWWSQPESYFLVDAASTTASSFSISNIPVGKYTAVEYTMGVDSLRNVSGSQTGALSLQNGMFWDWNSGYIMLKAEGYSPNSPTGGFALHLGGFSGALNIVTVKTAEFGKAITIDNSTNPTMTMTANPAKLWHSSPGLKTISVIHAPGVEAKQMAKDFYDNVSVSNIQ